MMGLKTILILHSLSSGSFWSAQIELGLKDELEKSGFRGRFETIHLPNLDQNAVLKRIDRSKPNCVVITNEPKDPSIIHKITTDRKIPVFFASIPKLEHQLTWMTPKNKNYLTGVLERTNIPKSVQTMEEIQGKKIKKLGVLGGGPTKNMQELAELIKHEMQVRKDIEVSVELGTTYEVWQKKILALDKNSDVTVPLLPYGMKSADSAKETDWHEINSFMIKNLSKPTIGIGCMHTPIKRTLSLTMKPRTIGIQVARMVHEHLEQGISISRIEIEYTKFFELEFSRPYLDRLGLKLTPEIASYATVLNE